MSVTVAMVRSQIADRPQSFPPEGTDPEVLGIGDGSRTIFALSFENFIAGTLTVFTALAPAAGVPAIFTAALPQSYKIGTPALNAAGTAPIATAATNQIVTFQTAPAYGTIVGARYQATAFSDADLAGYLSRALIQWPDDRLALKAVQFDLIDVILMDQRRLEMLSQGDFRSDKSAYIQGLRSQKATLGAELQGSITPGRSTPSLGVGVAGFRRYGSWR